MHLPVLESRYTVLYWVPGCIKATQCKKNMKGTRYKKHSLGENWWYIGFEGMHNGGVKRKGTRDQQRYVIFFKSCI